MAITTYAELKTALDNWLARSDLTSRTPEFIALCEARMNRELESRSQEKRVTSTFNVGDPYLTLPTDLRQIRTVRLNTSPRTVLKYLAPTAADDEFSGTGNGKPLAYSVIGNELYIRPTPDSAYTIEIAYVGAIDALSDSNTTNTILSRHPDAYLHGSLSAAYGYLLDDNRQAQHDALFTRALGEIKLEEDSVRWSGSPLTMQSQYGEIR